MEMEYWRGVAEVLALITGLVLVMTKKTALKQLGIALLVMAGLSFIL